MYLSYYQVMSLMEAIDQLRKSNQYFSSGIADNFEKYVIDRTGEIVMCSPIKLKLIPSASKYIVSKSMVAYLIRLTGVDIFDKKVLKEYTRLVKEFEHELETKNLNSLLEDNSQKRL